VQQSPDCECAWYKKIFIIPNCIISCQYLRISPRTLLARVVPILSTLAVQPQLPIQLFLSSPGHHPHNVPAYSEFTYLYEIGECFLTTMNLLGSNQ
jgi:hypothetical protein